MLSRITVAICESMQGVGGKRRLLSGGTGFLAISGIIFAFLVFNIWRDYWMYVAFFIVAAGYVWNWGGDFFLSSGWFMNWKVERQESGVSWRDTRSLIFNLEDIFFGGGFQFSCALLLEIEDWILNCWVDFRDSEFDMSSLRYCDVSTLRCCASLCTVQGGY